METILKVAILTAGLSLAGGLAPTRYKVPLNQREYPQVSPKQALHSVVKALRKKDFSYLLAHLADPQYVDARVKEYMTGFEGPEEAKRFVAFLKFVKDVQRHFERDPDLLRELEVLADKGEWKIDEKIAFVRRSKSSQTRATFMQIGGRWFLKNDRRPVKK